jgi:predicted Zn-dependent peptidase
VAARATATAIGTAPSVPNSRLSTEPAQLTTLDSGVRVVTEAMPSVRSIALGFWVRAGSRDEGSDQAGISHFLEHLLFKGTERFSSREIDELFDAMGAEVNAGTSKETTSVFSRFLDGHLERAFDVLQDMVLRPAYPDIDSERQVVIEEIAMYEDEPSDKVHDVLAGAIFGDHPLGRPIIGTADVVGSVPVPTVAAWHDGRYVPGNIVVAAAGNLEHERIVSLVEGAVGDPAPLPVGAASPQLRGPVLRFHEKETEQYHLCLGGPGIPRGDERRFALRILDTILGGSTSSRLFQEVREKRGLAYAVYSYASHYHDSGQVAVYIGTRPDNVTQAVEVIGAELERIQGEGVVEEELERARENVKGRTVLSMESTLTRMNRLGSSLLMDVPIMTVDELLAALDAVTLEDVNSLARELWAPGRLSAAGVGGSEERFRAALESVSPALAQAA